jgi:hypothetical protein
VKQVYICSAAAFRDSWIRHNSGALVAETYEEAVSRYLDITISRLRPALGYTGHTVECSPVSTDLLRVWIDLIEEENKNEDL